VLRKKKLQKRERWISVEVLLNWVSDLPKGLINTTLWIVTQRLAATRLP
jgi:hypothetical protein